MQIPIPHFLAPKKERKFREKKGDERPLPTPADVFDTFQIVNPSGCCTQNAYDEMFKPK